LKQHFSLFDISVFRKFLSFLSFFLLYTSKPDIDNLYSFIVSASERNNKSRVQKKLCIWFISFYNFFLMSDSHFYDVYFSEIYNLKAFNV
jgi:hypothetical protein